MNFLRFVGPLFFATRIADLLSIQTGVGSSGSISMSWRRRRIHVVCWAAAVAAMYSASHVDNGFIDCFIEPQHMGLILYRCTILDVALRLVKYAATSASLYVSRRLGIAWMVALRFPALYSSPCVAVSLRYRMRHFTAIQCLLVDALAATDNLFAK